MNHRLIAMSGALLLAACGGAEKDKPALGDDLATTMDAEQAAAPGGWTEIRTISSAHPYDNYTDQTWTVEGSSESAELRIVFDRFELEAGYDFVTVTGVNEVLHRFTGDRTGDEMTVPGNVATITFESDYSVTDWGFAIRVFERAACVCPQVYQPVCGEDGQTHGNACSAQCAGVRVAYPGECRADAWTWVPRRIESPHPYSNDSDDAWTIREAGATALRVHFEEIDVERGYDFVRVLDGQGRTVATYTGRQTDVTTPMITGDTAQVRLSSDYSITRWGFSVDGYDATGGCNSDAECGPGEVCNQPQCIRAPCFAVCEPAGNGGYTDVTVAQLEADPVAYENQPVRVTAEPGIRGAACTRRGCPASDPCCNACNAAFMLGRSIELVDEGGAPYDCRGNECNWRATCRQFQPNDSGPYVFEGTFERTGSGFQLRVDDFTAAACQPAGCSGQVCANTPNVVTTCEFRPEYACYRDAACEPQSTGHCGWTQTPELQMCLAGVSAQTVSAADTPLSIPDDDPAGITSAIEVPGGGGALGGASVSVDISHSYRGDLLVTLVAPDGQRIPLHEGGGGSNDDLVIDDRDLPQLAGANRAGTWTLEVVDRYRADVGTLNGWSLTLR